MLAVAARVTVAVGWKEMSFGVDARVASIQMSVSVSSQKDIGCQTSGQNLTAL